MSNKTYDSRPRKRQRAGGLEVYPLPTLLNASHNVVKTGVLVTDAASSEKTKLTFPNTYPLPSVTFTHAEFDIERGRLCNIGVVFHGGAAPGIVELLVGLYTSLKRWNTNSKLIAFIGGVHGILTGGKHIELTEDVLIDMQRRSHLTLIGTGRSVVTADNKKHILDTCQDLSLNGLLLLGGYEMNTEAAHLAEYFKGQKSSISVLTIPKRAEGLQSSGFEMSFGFDSLTKMYSQLVGNVCIDAASAKSTYHFIRLMGEKASNICLEVALQSHPNLCLLSEEVEQKGQSIADIVKEICDVVCVRACHNKNYGVIVIPEGLFLSAKDTRALLHELDSCLRSKTEIKLSPASQAVYDELPEWVRLQLVSDRDPSGKLRLASVQIERLFATLCEVELKKRKSLGQYVGKFAYSCHFYGYEARCCPASDFDKSLAFSLGYVVTTLVENGITGMSCCMTNLTEKVENWQVKGIPVTSTVHLDQFGDLKVVTSTVDLHGYAFKTFKHFRKQWVVSDLGQSPVGTLSDELPLTIRLNTLERAHEHVFVKYIKEQQYSDLINKCMIDQPTFARKRLLYKPIPPRVLTGGFQFDMEEATVPSDLAELFPFLSKQNYIFNLKPNTQTVRVSRTLNVGIILSGGPAPGGHNVIAGLFDFLANRNIHSKLYGFLDGPAGLVDCKALELTEEHIRGYRNQGGFQLIGSSRTKIESPEQFRKSLQTIDKYHLDGIVVCGGDDSNTNAALLAEYFVKEGRQCSVVGVPKTIDADLRSKEVEMSFGFDTTTKLYSQLIGNIAADASCCKTVYHFIRLMGRSASHITLECAMQTHANYAVISEEVQQKRQTMYQIVQDITELIVNRGRYGKNYGIILIPEGLIEFTVDMQQLIKELNEILCKEPVDVASALSPESQVIFNWIPVWMRAQLLGERDPHGNVRVSSIESERMVAALVQEELQKRVEYKHAFRYTTHFLGYQGRCGLPSNFDANYCYTLGHLSGALIESKVTGVIAAVSNLAAIEDKWELRGYPLVQMMNIERRKGKNVPVIEKKLVDLTGPFFTEFCAKRDAWGLEDTYPIPQRIKELNPTSDEVTLTLLANGAYDE